MSSISRQRREDQSAREAAQQKLVNTAIRHGVQTLYACAGTHDRAVNSTINNTNYGANAAEVIKNLCAIPNEFERLHCFSQLAKNNRFNLSIKSAGAKTPQSIRRKQSIPGLESSPLTDEVRVTIVSSDVELLNDLTTALQNDLRPETEPQGIPTNIEPWSLRSNGQLVQTLKTSVDGFGAEIQFLPREQARMASRIGHHFLKIYRAYDDVQKWLKTIPDLDAYKQKLFTRMFSFGHLDAAREAISATAKIDASLTMLNDYNVVAEILNHIASDEALNEKDRNKFNATFLSKDRSAYALDEATEVNDPAQEQKSKKMDGFSPIFKTQEDLLSYRDFMSEKGKEIHLFPLPYLSPESKPVEVEAAMMQLMKCWQLTHACYMRDAKEPMRKLWVEKAMKVNQRLDETKQIPATAIDWVRGDLQVAPPPPVLRLVHGH